MAQFEWGKRRKIIHITLAFCAGVVAACLVYAIVQGETELVKTLAVAACTSAMGVIGSYVFGATWDDANARKWGTPDPVPPSPPLVPEVAQDPSVPE